MVDDKKMFPRKLGYYIPRNLSHKGYVKYYDEENVRKRVYGDINQAKTYEDKVLRAERLMDQIREEYQPVLNLKARVADWIEEKGYQWRPKTKYQYESVARLFFKHLGDRAISTEIVNTYFTELITVHKLSRGTHNNYRRFLKRMLVDNGAGEHIENVPHLRHQGTPKKYFQRHQRIMIKKAIENSDDELWFVCECIYYLFIRPNSELRRLKAQDFDLDRWRVFIDSHISKNGKAEHVAIPTAFRKRVEEFISPRRPNEYIFPGIFNKTKPVGYNYFINRFRAVLDDLGFDFQHSLYSFKHTGAIACVNQGIHPSKIQVQMRHSNLEMTSRYLRQIGVDDLEDLEDQFPAI